MHPDFLCNCVLEGQLGTDKQIAKSGNTSTTINLLIEEPLTGLQGPSRLPGTQFKNSCNRLLSREWLNMQINRTV